MQMEEERTFSTPKSTRKSIITLFLVSSVQVSLANENRDAAYEIHKPIPWQHRISPRMRTQLSKQLEGSKPIYCPCSANHKIVSAWRESLLETATDEASVIHGYPNENKKNEEIKELKPVVASSSSGGKRWCWKAPDGEMARGSGMAGFWDSATTRMFLAFIAVICVGAILFCVFTARKRSFSSKRKKKRKRKRKKMLKHVQAGKQNLDGRATWDLKPSIIPTLSVMCDSIEVTRDEAHLQAVKATISQHMHSGHPFVITYIVRDSSVMIPTQHELMKSRRVTESSHEACNSVRDVIWKKIRKFFSSITVMHIPFCRDDARRFGRYFDLTENQLDEHEVNTCGRPQSASEMMVQVLETVRNLKGNDFSPLCVPKYFRSCQMVRLAETLEQVLNIQN